MHCKYQVLAESVLSKNHFVCASLKKVTKMQELEVQGTWNIHEVVRGSEWHLSHGMMRQTQCPY